jgi:hypothetical protein
VQVEDAHVATKSEQRDQETDLLSTRSAISMSAASDEDRKKLMRVLVMPTMAA